MWYSPLLEALRETLDRVMLHFPAVAGALLLLLIGWGVAWIFSRVVRGIAGRLLARLGRGAIVGDAIATSGAATVAPRLVGGFAFWLVLLLFAVAAVEVLGLSIVTDLLGQMTAWAPNVFAAAVIAFGGLVGARISRAAVARACETAGIAQSAAIANAVHAVVLVMVMVIAAEQLGIRGRVLELTLAVTIGATLAGAALAFGLGARASVANIIASRYVTEICRIGQTIRIDGVEGTVAQLTPTAVLVDTADGRVVVPAGRFHETCTLLLGQDS
jgi:hypothetical protein